MNPRVSVILPAFNRLEFLQNAVASVLGQTLAEWELLLVDDGSDAATRAWLDSLANQPRVRVFLRGHCGNPAMVRNAGIREARGEYVAFLDSDDVWAPHKLSAQLDSLRRSGHRWGYTAFRHIDASAEPLVRSRYQAWRPSRHGTLEGVVRFDAMIPLPSVMVERALLIAAGPFDERLRFYEDYDLWFRLALLAEADAVPIPLVSIRRHSQHYSDADHTLTRENLDQLFATMLARLEDEPLRRLVRRQRAVNSARLAGLHAAAHDRLGMLRSLRESWAHSKVQPLWWAGAARAFARCVFPPARRAVLREDP